MPSATVLIPTHSHTNTLAYSIRSVQRQTFTGFALFVVGDGASSATRDLVLTLAASDSRIRYFDLPKGERNGEENRAAALKAAQGEIVAYCSDDDLWLPNHLSDMVNLLKTNDVGQSRSLEIDEYGRVHGGGGDISDPNLRKLMCETTYYNVGLTTVAHSMKAYRLSGGWSPAPTGVPTDLYMLRKFFSVADLRFSTALEPSTIRFGPFAGMMRFPDLEAPPSEKPAGESGIAIWSERINSLEFRDYLRAAANASTARRAAFGIVSERFRQDLSLTLQQLQHVQSQNDQLLTRIQEKDENISALEKVIEGAWADQHELRRMLSAKEAENAAFGVLSEGFRENLSLTLQQLQAAHSRNDQLLKRIEVKDQNISALEKAIEQAWSDQHELRRMLSVKEAENEHLRAHISALLLKLA